MERQGFEIPLLIGGATTSRAHTAVKVDPKYHGPVVWVKDASRSVPVVAALLSDEQRPDAAGRRRPRTTTRSASGTPPSDATVRCRSTQARANRTPIDWTGYRPPRPRCSRSRRRTSAHGHPTSTGTRRRSSSRSCATTRSPSCASYIDWQPFFNAWEMKGRFPDILNNPASGEAARKLYDDAQAMLDQLIEETLAARQRRGRAVPGQRGRRRRHRGLHRRVAHDGAHHAAQPAPAGRAPRRACPTARSPTSSRRRRPGLHDYVGAFAVTAGLGAGEKIKEFKAALDDYSAILLESLADRLAEAFAERLHERVRTRVLGLRARRAPRQRGADRGAATGGIRPGARLPGLPRPHREGHALGAARRRGQHRHRADREHGDVARRGGQRLVLLAPAVAVLRGRPDRPRPGRGLRRPQGLDAAPRPSAGSRPTSATNPRTDRLYAGSTAPGRRGRPEEVQ